MFVIGPLVSLALILAPQTAPSKGLEGTWQGFLSPKQGIEFRLILKVEKGPDGKLRAEFESPEHKMQPAVTFDEVSFQENQAVLVAKKPAREFRATMNSAGNELKGDWKVGFVSNPIMFARIEGPAPPSEVWEGSLAVNGGLRIRLVFHVLKINPGEIRATMDSPDQGAFGFKVTTTEIGNDSLKFSIKNLGEFEGKLDQAGAEAVGHWKQGGASLPLTLKKVEKVTEIRRPQLPKAPFSYDSQDVTYESRAKGVRLAGTLTLPTGDGPFAVALLITGSGSQDRDESLLGHKPFLVLADDLTRRGVAVLRVDDRGVGGSTGNPAEATTLDYVEDVLGGIDFLKAHPKIDPRRIGLIGHSEGGLIAPIVATRSSDVAFIVMMAGPGLPGDEIIAAQVGLILKAAGAEDPKVQQTVEIQRRLMAIVKDHPDEKAVIEKLKSTYADLIKTLPEEERKAIAAADPNGAQLSMLATPWFRYFLSYDPRPTLAKVTCPILAINGENDLQVPCKENLEAIEKAIRSGSNTSLTLRPMPGLNHLFQTSKTGSPSRIRSHRRNLCAAGIGCYRRMGGRTGLESGLGTEDSKILSGGVEPRRGPPQWRGGPRRGSTPPDN